MAKESWLVKSHPYLISLIEEEFDLKMTDLKEIIYLLYSASFNSTSLRVLSMSQRIIDRYLYAVEMRNRQYPYMQNDFFGEDSGVVSRKILWKRPYHFSLHESYQINGINHFNYQRMNESYYFSYTSKSNKFYRRRVRLFEEEYEMVRSGSKYSKIETTYANHSAMDLLFIDPSSFIWNTDLQIVGKGEFLDRDVYHLRAYPKCHSFIKGPSDSYFQLPEYFDLLVDAERGNLLKYELFFEGEVIEFCEITDIAFDIPLGDDEFDDFNWPDRRPSL